MNTFYLKLPLLCETVCVKAWRKNGRRRAGTAHVVSRCSLTAENRLSNRATAHGIMLDKVAHGQVSLQVLRCYDPSPLNQRSTQIRQYIDLFLEKKRFFQ